MILKVINKMNPDLLQLGATAVVAIAAFGVFAKIIEALLKRKKNTNGISDMEKVRTELALVNQKLNNHIEHIGDDIREIKNEIKEIRDLLNK